MRCNTGCATAAPSARSSTTARSPTCWPRARECPALAHVVTVGGADGQGDVDWLDALRAQSERCDPVDTAADDPAILIYTSGTTGPPKGALIAHRGLIGNLTGFVCSQNWFGFGEERDRPLSLGKGERGKGASVQGTAQPRGAEHAKRVLVARGLGVDRRPDGCAAADAVLRPRDHRLPGALRSDQGVRADAALSASRTRSCSRPR